MTRDVGRLFPQESDALFAFPRPCDRCGKRPGTKPFGDSLTLSHGFGQKWCGRCIARVQLRHAVGRAVRIPILVWRSIRG